jgi:hypothetical protein
MGRRKTLKKRIKGLEKQREIHLDKQDQTTDEYLKKKYYPKEIQKFKNEIEDTERLLNRKKRKKRKPSDEDIAVVYW